MDKRSTRHSHHRKKHRRDGKLAQFIKKNKKQLVAVAVFIVLLVGLIIFVAMDNNRPDDDGLRPQSNTQPSTVQLTNSIHLSVPLFREEIPLVDQGVNAYLNAHSGVPVEDALHQYRETGMRLDKGLAVKLEYDVLALPKGCAVVSSQVDVSEDSGFSASRVMYLPAGQRSVEIKHLKTGTTYHYRITVNLSNGTSTAITGAFTTAAAPRILSIDGIVNVRDIGGWKTFDGRIIRQGLLYRGSEMDGVVQDDYRITNTGIQDMLGVLGIRTEMDLRSDVAGHDILGIGVDRKQYSGSVFYDNIFTDLGKSAVKEIFTDLANPDNYPIYMHCTYGMDRTGTICYLLEALLGVSEEDLIREYELSALAHVGMSRAALRPMLETLNTYGGDSIQENVELYLRSVGITDAQMESLRTIYLQ